MTALSPKTREILLSLSEDDWRGYYRELVLYAYARCSRWLWRTGDKQNLPEGHSPESITQEAVLRLYDGTRTWNHEQYPGNNPVPFLKAVIDSLIWALLSGAEHLRRSAVGDPPSVGSNSPEPLDLDIDADEGLHHSPSLAPDRKLYLEDVEHRIRMAIANRPDLLEFFEYLLEGLKPREISKRLNVDVKRVYALRKTFDRRTDEIQRELFGRQPSEDAVGRDAERVKI